MLASILTLAVRRIWNGLISFPFPIMCMHAVRAAQTFCSLQLNRAHVRARVSEVTTTSAQAWLQGEQGLGEARGGSARDYGGANTSTTRRLASFLVGEGKQSQTRSLEARRHLGVGDLRDRWPQKTVSSRASVLLVSLIVVLVGFTLPLLTSQTTSPETCPLATRTIIWKIASLDYQSDAKLQQSAQQRVSVRAEAGVLVLGLPQIARARSRSAKKGATVQHAYHGRAGAATQTGVTKAGDVLVLHGLGGCLMRLCCGLCCPVAQK
ncbi:hypothetical protein VTI74DRAFT_52 [Chaetomium olivicolor]